MSEERSEKVVMSVEKECKTLQVKSDDIREFADFFYRNCAVCSLNGD